MRRRVVRRGSNEKKGSERRGRLGVRLGVDFGIG